MPLTKPATEVIRRDSRRKRHLSDWRVPRSNESRCLCFTPGDRQHSLAFVFRSASRPVHDQIPSRERWLRECRPNGTAPGGAVNHCLKSG